MNPVHRFLPILAFLLVWHPVIQAQNCTQQQGASSSFDALQACVACENQKNNNQVSPASCRTAAELWCTTAKDPCSDSECRSTMPGCKAAVCAEQAKSATSHEAFLQQCSQCESGSAATMQCTVAAMDWCKTHCEDPFCAQTITECSKSPFEVNVDKTICPPGQKRVGMSCVPNLTKLDADAAMNNCRAQISSADQSCTAANQVFQSLRPSSPSLKDQCAALAKNGKAAAQKTAAAGKQCHAASQECRSVCESGARKFGSESSFGNQVRTMSEGVQTCDSFYQQSRRSSQQGFEYLNDAGIADQCEKLAKADSDPPRPGPNPAPSPSPSPGPSPNPSPSPSYGNNQNTQKPQSASPSGGGGMPSLPSMSSPSSSSAQSGFANSYAPASADTQQPQEAQQPTADPSGFRNPGDPTTEKSFNVGDLPNGSRGFAGATGNGPPNIPGGGRGGQPTVANNSGGGIPGADGGPGARIPPRRGGHAPSGGVSTDVLQGFQGGGGYSNSGSGSGLANDDSGARYRGGGRGGRNPAGQEMDLRQYLPGGRRDPGRRPGGYQPFSMADINSRHVNIWIKIGDRLREKCRLGELYDCR